MFEFTFRDKLILAAAMVVGAALIVWAAVVAGDYISTNRADPLAKAGGLNPQQRRAVEGNR